MTPVCSRTTQTHGRNRYSPTSMMPRKRLVCGQRRSFRTLVKDHRSHPLWTCMQGNTAEPTDCFTHLGSQIHSSQSHAAAHSLRYFDWSPLPRINVVGRLTNVWRLSKLSLCTKMRLYYALVNSVLYCTARRNMDHAEIWWAEAWGLPQSWQRRILGMRYSTARVGYDFVTSVNVHGWPHTSGIRRVLPHTYYRDDGWRCSVGRVTFVDFQTQLQRAPHFVSPWLVAGLMADQDRNDRAGDQETTGSTRWRSPWNGGRHRLERCNRAWCLEGATIHSRSCGLVSEWVATRSILDWSH